MKKVFITGGAGFIGSHVVDTLIPKGVAVTVYDNFSTGRMSNLKQHVGTPHFSIVNGDVTDFGHLLSAMYGHDLVWHLGANTIMQNATNDYDLGVNTVGTCNVLEAMRQLQITDILFASTAAAYGDEPGHSFDESFGPMRPISLYGASKLAAEAFVSAYSHLYGIESWIFRFSNVVGGGMGHGVIYDFVQKLLSNPKELEVWGDGQGVKPYFLVEDCIQGMLCAYRARIESDLPHKCCDVYNLGTTTTTQVDKVAEIVIDEMGLKDVRLIHTGGRHGFPGDVPNVDFNASKMASYGWRARSTSDEAVRIAARRIIRGTR